MIPVGTTHSPKINYVDEREGGVQLDRTRLEFTTRVAEVVVRDWDVTDAEARAIAAEEQLGEGANDDEWYVKHAMWFVHAEANAAVLIVFRPKPKSVEVKAT